MISSEEEGLSSELFDGRRLTHTDSLFERSAPAEVEAR